MRREREAGSALAGTPRQRHWPVITFVNSDTASVSVLQGLGFVQHRLLTQCTTPWRDAVKCAGEKGRLRKKGRRGNFE